MRHVEPAEVRDRGNRSARSDDIRIADLHAERLGAGRLVINRLAMVPDRRDVGRGDACRRKQLRCAFREELADGMVESAELGERRLGRFDQSLDARPQRLGIRRSCGKAERAARVVDLREHGIDAVDARAGNHSDIEVAHAG